MIDKEMLLKSLEGKYYLGVKDFVDSIKSGKYDSTSISPQDIIENSLPNNTTISYLENIMRKKILCEYQILTMKN